MQRRYFIEFAEKFLYTYINGVMAKLIVGDIIWSTNQNRKFLIKKEKWRSKNHSWVWSYFQKLSLEHWLFKCKIEGRYNVFVYGVTGRLKKKKMNLYTVLTVLLIFIWCIESIQGTIWAGSSTLLTRVGKRGVQTDRRTQFWIKIHAQTPKIFRSKTQNFKMQTVSNIHPRW